MTHTPTPAEIETLRDVVEAHRPESRTYTEKRASALTILDRLSPPAPEVDEATVWTRRVLDADWGYWGSNTETRSKIIRNILSELIASKDAEITRWKADHDSEKKWAIELEDVVREAQAKLAALRAENERRKANEAHLRQLLSIQEGISDTVHEALWAADKAAERNTAEPAADGQTSVFPPIAQPAESWSVIDSAPIDSGMDAEAVEQAELLWAQLPVNRKWTSIPTHEKALVCHLLSTYRTEAEARGRREALEEAIAAFDTKIPIRFTSIEIVDELKRLMTERK